MRTSSSMTRSHGIASGTPILTRDGPVPVDWVAVGDEVWTQDNGWQAVRWRAMAPSPRGGGCIEIRSGACGPDTPAEAIRVAPGQRLLLGGAACELQFGTAEVFVTACDLLHWPGIAEAPMHDGDAQYLLLFDRHEVVSSHGIGLGTQFLGDGATASHPAPPLGLINTLSLQHGQTARLCLMAREARLLQPGAFPSGLLLPEAAPGADLAKGSAAVA